jgi:hypothetical protein
MATLYRTGDESDIGSTLTPTVSAGGDSRGGWITLWLGLRYLELSPAECEALEEALREAREAS